jgi:hypothetical protein
MKEIDFGEGRKNHSQLLIQIYLFVTINDAGKCLNFFERFS